MQKRGHGKARTRPRRVQLQKKTEEWRRRRQAAMPRSTKARDVLRYGGLSREKPDWRVATWRAMRARTKLRKRAAPSRPASGARGGQAQRIKGMGKAWEAALAAQPRKPLVMG